MRKLLVVVAVIAAGSSFAQTEKKKVEAPKAPVSHVEFGEGDVIDGTVDGPDMGLVTSAPKPRFGNMIKIRTNFSDKLLQSVHEL